MPIRAKTLTSALPARHRHPRNFGADTPFEVRPPPLRLARCSRSVVAMQIPHID
jgi:hypothetical protein